MSLAAPSLRRAVLLNLLVPVLALALGIAALGYFVIGNVVEAAHDRLLDGSLMAIAERLAVEDGEVTVDMPQVALGMLESKAQDSVYYLVLAQNKPITGYQDLPLAGAQEPITEQPGHWDETYRGNAVRVAAVSRRIYGLDHPVVVVVAETRMARDQLRHEMLRDLGLALLVLIVVIAVIAWFSVEHGLEPLALLSRQIDDRAVSDWRDLRPLDLAAVPQEALAPARAMNAMLDRLRSAIELLRRFTADASHQMRTPLAVLRMHVELLRRAAGDPAMSRQALDEIHHGTLRLERLITQLLALARADESLVAPVAFQPVDLGEVITGVVGERVIGLPRDTQLSCDVPPAPILIRSEPVLLAEALGNLIDNAIKYSGAAGIVSITVACEGQEAVILIEDSGPGIPEAERDKAFARFYRIPNASNAPGSGLGLAIVGVIVQHLGGRITLGESATLKGLSVRLTLPLAAGP